MIGRMRVIGRWTAAGLVAAMSFAAAHAGQVAPNGNNSSAEAVPVETAPDPAYTQYIATLVQSLADSSDPHDWAMASLIDIRDFPRGRALSERAASAAPDDALLQWIAEFNYEPKAAAATPQAHADAALLRLQALEPSNASVWLRALIHADFRHDAAGIDSALQRMAASTQIDEHQVTVLKALISDFEQQPPPEALLTAYRAPNASANDLAIARQRFAYFMSASIVNARSMPPYQVLFAACKPNAGRGLSVARADECARAGRLLATQAKTPLANLIGFAVLRVSRTYTDQDVQAARSLDWVWEKFVVLNSQTSAAAITSEQIACMTQWLETGSEVEAWRLALQRNHIATEPPSNWIDDRSPFRAERLLSDKESSDVDATAPNEKLQH